MIKTACILILLVALFFGCNPYRISKIDDLKRYEGIGEIYKTKCEQIFTSPQTEGFIAVSVDKSVVPEIAKSKAKSKWEKALLKYMPSHIKEICMYDKQLRKLIKRENLTDTLLYMLTDSLITNYPNSIMHTCSEVNPFNRETGGEYYSYYVVEYHYTQFVRDLREMSNKNAGLPLGITKEIAWQIAEITDKIGAELGEHIWIDKCKVWN